MDYEKKYNEALERARALWREAIEKGYPNDYLKDYETIFPELRESEDERMVREFNDWLCEEIECRTNDLRDEKDRRTLNMLCYVLTKVKDWFEKQKESLHISEMCKENADSFTDEDERIRKGLIAMLSQDKELHRREIAYLEKKKVPEGLHPEEYPLTPDECVKPVEWSEKDKEMLMRCIAAIPVQGDEIMLTSYLNKLRNWLEFLPERFNLPPKQEWSEEDEKRYISCLLRLGTGNPDQPETINSKWFKERVYSRPHWKPSEEQMEHLKRCFSHGKPHLPMPNQHVLESLYEQLKKL